MIDPVKYNLSKRGAKNKAYDSDVDGVFDLVTIPTIPRTKLEYPTEDVPFIYLIAIGKVTFTRVGVLYNAHTVDQFADKAIDTFQLSNGYQPVSARQADPSKFDNRYIAYVDTGKSTADFILNKQVNGAYTTLATESVDLTTQSYLIRLSCSGSTIKAFRDDLTTSKLSVTDTDLTSGHFVVNGTRMNYYSYADIYSAYLRSPSTPIPKALTIVEAETVGSGTEEDPIRPNMSQELVEVSKAEVSPEVWIALQNNPKSKNGLPLVNKQTVVYCVFDHKPEHNTMLTIITSGNMYIGDKAITEQIEYAKSKNLKVLKPPSDYSEAIEQHRQLRVDFPEWIAGKDNYAYQTLGHEDFERFQVADTYHGNIVEGYKPDAYKNVPEWELWRTLAMWKERLKRAEVAKTEAEKHLKKLEEVEKKGW